MQEMWRLKYRRAIVIELDRRAALRAESMQRMQQDVSNNIVVKPTIVKQTPFEQYVQYVKEHTTELTCHHGKFHWSRCNSCRRTDATQLWHLQKYYRDKIVKILTNTHSQ